jgi:thiosulfate/3-mercaptopyruvate sulfurtransferase
MAAEYVHPEVLVTTEWVDQHKNDPKVRIVESDEDVLLYQQGHVPSAVRIDWHTDLQDAVIRDYVGKAEFERLCSSKGIANDTTVVFYGDKNNWWACYAFWAFKLYGHEKCLIMNGGRKRWELDGRQWSRDPEPSYPKTNYQAKDPDASIRAFRDEVLKHQRAGKQMIDVRSPGEYTGELLHMPDYPQEGALRGGHIPGAINIPWAKAVADDGTFKSAKELEKLYAKECGLKRRGLTIAYCRIGERSSHTWFVLKYLLGYPNVKNYDGSWTEWGNLVGSPIEKGPGRTTFATGDGKAAKEAPAEVIPTGP